MKLKAKTTSKSGPEVTTESAVLDTAVGAILPGATQFIRQILVAEQDALVVELPGQITRCGTAAAFAIKPHARLLVSASDGWRTATLSAAVIDEPGLDRALTRLLKEGDLEEATGFAVRMSARVTFGELFDRAESGLGGCGCAEGYKSAKVLGALKVGLAFKPRHKLLWTDPVSTLIYARTGDNALYGPINPRAGATASSQTCKSVWNGIANRSTDCVGSCPSCKCETVMPDGSSVWTVQCSGWCTCWCR